MTPESPQQREGLPIGSGNEANRHAWVRAVLRQIPADKRLLDAGAGTQRYRDACRHLIYVAHDFGRYDGTGNRSGLQTGEFNYGRLDIVSDITAIPEPDNAFDIVLCTEVLEHVPHPEAALRELVRLVKPGGELILTAPFVSFTHFAPYHFCTGFSRYFHGDQLAACGLEILEMTPNGGFFDFVAQEVRRTRPMAERYAHTRLTLLERVAEKIFLRALQRLRQNDRDSAELACFGWHVRARKPPAPP